MTVAPTPGPRVVLTYRAPVYVTVNVDTGDVERVFMDDESVQLDTGARFIDADTDQERFYSGQRISRALEIADGVDWTSTQGRCQVWRGAVGGPANLDEMIDRAIDALALDPEGWGYTEGDVKAARLFIADVDAWKAER